MGYCTKCGTFLGEHANGTCSACQSSAHGIGTPEEVPCQRCGMYLPSHELQMWNSRLYCNYCIMDIRDEEKMITDRHNRGSHVPAGGSGREPFGQEHGSNKGRGVCERCGSEASTLYTVSGRRLCERCYNEEGAGSASSSGSSFFAQLVVRAAKAVGLGDPLKPKVIAKKPIPARGVPPLFSGGRKVFDTKTRKWVEKNPGGKRED